MDNNKLDLQNMKVKSILPPAVKDESPCRMGRDTTNAIMDFVDEINHCFQDGQVAAATFFDLSKAFVPELAPQRKQTNADDNVDSKNANEEQLMACIREL
jgi:hypothetical protein